MKDPLEVAHISNVVLLTRQVALSDCQVSQIKDMGFVKAELVESDIHNAPTYVRFFVYVR